MTERRVECLYTVTYLLILHPTIYNFLLLFHILVPQEVTDHMKHLEKMIDAQRETQHELEVELDKKDKLIKENEYTYKRMKMKQIEELRAKNKDIEQMRAELDASANSTAYYQNELLKMKKAKLISNPDTDGAMLAPTPPKESKSNPKRAFHIRRTLGDNYNKDDLKVFTQVRPGASGTRMNSGGSGSNRSDSPTELVKPFLRSEDSDVSLKQSNPLPPIRTSSGRLVLGEPVDVVQVSVHNVPKPLMRGKKPVTTVQEVETLAVGQVSHNDPAWKHQRRKESHSSDYR